MERGKSNDVAMYICTPQAFAPACNHLSLTNFAHHSHLVSAENHQTNGEDGGCGNH